jgi:hypothetical protein
MQYPAGLIGAQLFHLWSAVGVETKKTQIFS